MPPGVSTLVGVRATVVGAGVSGLTTARVLRDAGWEVGVVARESFESAVSSVAAAVWTITDAEPVASARRWALASRERFAGLADDPSTGVVPLHHRELDRTPPSPSWWERHPFVRRLEPGEVPPGYAGGFAVDGFMIEPPIYLAWLTDRLANAGVDVSTATIASLGEVDGDVVVNCTGLGAAQLAADDEMYPIRGHVVVAANPGVREAVADESDQQRIAYVYPRSRHVVLGGTRQAEREAPEPDPAETQRILADCAALDPRVAGCDVVTVRIGLRPGRPAVRVELDRLPDGRPLVHNYGHSGAGYILSWGCALDVAGLLAT